MARRAGAARAYRRGRRGGTLDRDPDIVRCRLGDGHGDPARWRAGFGHRMSRPASPFGIGTGGPAPAPGFAGFGARRPAGCPAVPTLLAACIAACIVAGSLVLSEPAIG